VMAAVGLERCCSALSCGSGHPPKPSASWSTPSGSSWPSRTSDCSGALTRDRMACQWHDGYVNGTAFAFAHPRWRSASGTVSGCDPHLPQAPTGMSHVKVMTSPWHEGDADTGQASGEGSIADGVINATGQLNRCAVRDNAFAQVLPVGSRHDIGNRISVGQPRVERGGASDLTWNSGTTNAANQPASVRRRQITWQPIPLRMLPAKRRAIAPMAARSSSTPAIVRCAGKSQTTVRRISLSENMSKCAGRSPRTAARYPALFGCSDADRAGAQSRWRGRTPRVALCPWFCPWLELPMRGSNPSKPTDLPDLGGFWGLRVGFYASPKPKVESSNLSCPASQVPYGRLGCRRFGDLELCSETLLPIKFEGFFDGQGIRWTSDFR
jgi:hypothetical protein